jgi:hypothetical protein
LLREGRNDRASLVAAVRAGDIELIRRLRIADANMVTIEGTLLAIAASSSDLDVVSFLLSIPGIDGRALDLAGDSPFVVACHYSHRPVWKLIADFCGDDLRCDYPQVNAGFLAACRRRDVDFGLELMPFFSQFAGLDPNFCDSAGQLSFMPPVPPKSLDQNDVPARDESDWIKMMSSLVTAIDCDDLEIATEIISHPSFGRSAAGSVAAVLQSVAHHDGRYFEKVIGDCLGIRDENGDSVLAVALENMASYAVEIIVNHPAFDLARPDPARCVLAARYAASLGIVRAIPGADLNAHLPHGVNGFPDLGARPR